MQFVILAQDVKQGGLEKRLKVREEHVAMGDKMKEAGQYHMGVAMLDEAVNMCGSVMIVEFPSRKELDEWLSKEPYVVNNVWESWEIHECKIGPTFL